MSSFLSTALSSSFTPSSISSTKDHYKIASSTQISLLNKKPNNQHFHVSACKAIPPQRKNNKNSSSSSLSFETSKVDRRNMLLGLGGAYGAATIIGDKLALGADCTDLPLPYPDLTACTKSVISPIPDDPNAEQVECCPPTPLSEIKPYKIPVNPVKRIRPAAHLVDEAYIRKYMNAIEAMKALPDKDPRSFYQQAKIHCAYCNYGHKVKHPVTGEEVRFSVHGNWFFLPFHRWYLYFFERIAGELINDPTFALPYWNWDAPCGMTIPAMFVPEMSPLAGETRPNPLYDALRNPDHLPLNNDQDRCRQIVFDLNFNRAGGDNQLPDITRVCNNLAFVYRNMVSNAVDAERFMGNKYYVGCDIGRGAGSCELLHNPAHSWTGTTQNNNEDMGNFYSAGFDPIFYCHHGNVDRTWDVWRKLGGNDFGDQAWLDSKFFFYDELGDPVYVSVKDCLDEEKLGYEYQKVELPWLQARPPRKLEKSDVAANSTAPTVANAFPAKLDKVIKVLVQRPKKARSASQKKKKKEILVFQDIEYPMNEFVKFDVFINDEDEVGDLMSKAEFAGTFSTIPHGKGHEGGQVMASSFTIGLDEVLEDLQADDDEYILVTLIPKAGGNKVTIDGLKIDFV
ncbi:hypothetical protein Leryth_027477 [Lithospermum erythrorhizon]|nr:hypothetical protein Leryth_027477 [Lithospermum erythrorhizon]